MPLAGYSGTPLVKKLGIKPGARVAVIAAPPGFDRALVGLPPDVRLLTRAAGAPDLVIWFVRSRRDLDARAPRIAGLIAMGAGLWIAWPKKASGVKTDVVEDLVRGAGLAHGLVDYKVCAINETWSGLKFSRRREPRDGQERR
jgi:hypothetical protein